MILLGHIEIQKVVRKILLGHIVILSSDKRIQLESVCPIFQIITSSTLPCRLCSIPLTVFSYSYIVEIHGSEFEETIKNGGNI